MGNLSPWLIFGIIIVVLAIIVCIVLYTKGYFSILHRAIEKGDVEKARMLIEKKSEIRNPKNQTSTNVK